MNYWSGRNNYQNDVEMPEGWNFLSSKQLIYHFDDRPVRCGQAEDGWDIFAQTINCKFRTLISTCSPNINLFFFGFFPLHTIFGLDLQRVGLWLKIFGRKKFAPQWAPTGKPTNWRKLCVLRAKRRDSSANRNLLTAPGNGNRRCYRAYESSGFPIKFGSRK